jgi:outer membrane murein-binding lipoprotein Lpp
MKVWNLAKGLGVVIVGAIAFSGNSGIAKINQSMTLKNNLNAPTLNTAIKKQNTLGEDALKINYSIKQTQSQNRNAVDKKKLY